MHHNDTGTSTAMPTVLATSSSLPDGSAITLSLMASEPVEEDYAASVRLSSLPAATQQFVRAKLKDLSAAIALMDFNNKTIDATGVTTREYIMNLRRKELDAAMPNARKLQKAVDAIEYQKLLLQNLYALKKTYQTEWPDRKNSICYYPAITLPKIGYTNDAMEELKNAVALARNKILLVISPILLDLNSPKKVGEMKLMNETSVVLLDFYKDPHNPDKMAALLHTANRIHRQSGSYWRPLVHAIALVIAATCILIAGASIIPSIAASTALAAVAFLIIVAVGNSMRSPLDKNTLLANSLRKDLLQINEYGKRLTFFKSAANTIAEKKIADKKIIPADQRKRFIRRRTTSDTSFDFSAQRLHDYSQENIDAENARRVGAGKGKTKRVALQLIASKVIPGQPLPETGTARGNDERESRSIRPHFMR